jgi:hypothetical protein
VGSSIETELEQRIKAALDGGMTHREAARHFRVARGTVARIATGKPAQRQESPCDKVRPHRVPWFDCPECYAASNLKWDGADVVCFACTIRERARRERGGLA